jgi:hypothetical protein
LAAFADRLDPEDRPDNVSIGIGQAGAVDGRGQQDLADTVGFSVPSWQPSGIRFIELLGEVAAHDGEQVFRGLAVSGGGRPGEPVLLFTEVFLVGPADIGEPADLCPLRLWALGHGVSAATSTATRTTPSMTGRQQPRERGQQDTIPMFEATLACWRRRTAT